MNQLKDYVPSLIRTWVPILVTSVVTLLADNGVVVDESTSNAGVVFIGGVLGAIYYAIVRLLEAKAGPIWGVLLGYTKQPQYTPPR